MEQFTLAHDGSLLLTLAFVRGVLGLLLKLMTLHSHADYLTASQRDTAQVKDPARFQIRASRGSEQHGHVENHIVRSSK
jgi:hypothetical protein